jgi:UDP-N-acetylmuramate dehydrogenase
LPDPAVLGNAGSFFKNPVLTQSAFDCIREEHPAIPHYPAADGVKLAAGWLIEQAGWKGCDRGTHGVHDRQALVLVNRGGATGQEILALSAEIQASVSEKFNVELQREVNIW